MAQHEVIVGLWRQPFAHLRKLRLYARGGVWRQFAVREQHLVERVQRAVAKGLLRLYGQGKGQVPRRGRDAETHCRAAGHTHEDDGDQGHCPAPFQPGRSAARATTAQRAQVSPGVELELRALRQQGAQRHAGHRRRPAHLACRQVQRARRQLDRQQVTAPADARDDGSGVATIVVVGGQGVQKPRSRSST